MTKITNMVWWVQDTVIICCACKLLSAMTHQVLLTQRCFSEFLQIFAYSASFVVTSTCNFLTQHSCWHSVFFAESGHFYWHQIFLLTYFWRVISRDFCGLIKFCWHRIFLLNQHFCRDSKFFLTQHPLSSHRHAFLLTQ